MEIFRIAEHDDDEPDVETEEDEEQGSVNPEGIAWNSKSNMDQGSALGIEIYCHNYPVREVDDHPESVVDCPEETRPSFFLGL